MLGFCGNHSRPAPGCHRPPSGRRQLALTYPREAYLYLRNRTNSMPPERAARNARELQHDMGLEREFVAAGGLSLAGPDPTGNGAVIPGFGDLREIELLIEAGFTAPQADPCADATASTERAPDCRADGARSIDGKLRPTWSLQNICVTRSGRGKSPAACAFGHART